MLGSFKQSLIARFEKFSEKALILLENSIIKPSVNEEDSPVVLIGPDHPWGELDQDSKRLQTELYNGYHHLSEICRTILANALPEVQSEFDRECKPITALIEQSSFTWYETIKQAISAFEESLINKLRP